MDLDLRLVRYFVAVADELHFGRAAARLYVSQPALSKQIRKLEDQLGEPLFERDSRHVSLTARGRQFYEDARRLLAIADAMRQPSRADGLRIAHIHELSTSRAVADAFARGHPDVPLLEHAMDSVTQLNALLERRHGRGDPAGHSPHAAWPIRPAGGTGCCVWSRWCWSGPAATRKRRRRRSTSAPSTSSLTLPSPAHTTPTGSTSPRSSTTSGSR